MSSSAPREGGGGRGGGRNAGDRSSGTRGPSQSSRSGRSRRGPKQSATAPPAADSDGTSVIPGSAEAGPQATQATFQQPAVAVPATKRDDGLVPGAGLLALQALAPAQTKGDAGRGWSGTDAASSDAAANATERAAADGPKEVGATGRGDKGRSRGRSGGRGGASNSQGGGATAPSLNTRGPAERGRDGHRGIAAAAMAAATKGTSSSRGRGKGSGDDRNTSKGGAAGAKNSSAEERQVSEAEHRRKTEDAKKLLAAQQEQRRKAEEERRRKAEEDRRAREEQRARREAEEQERRAKAEAATKKKELAEKKAAEAKRRLEEKRRKAEEQRQQAAARAKAIEEEAKRKETEERRDAERRRLEEERVVEEEKRQKEAEQERARREFEAQMEAVSHLGLLQKEEQARQELRAKHTPEALKASREAHETSKSRLKSDLKRTLAFTKKVKSISEDQRSSVTKEVENLNLSRYVSEIADAVADNKLKSADVPVAVHLCCLMHQRYAEFTSDLIPKLSAPLLAPAVDDDKDDKEQLRRKRSSLRLLTELHASGVFDGSRLIVRIVQALCGQEGKEGGRRQRAAPSSGDLRRREQGPTVTAAPHPLRESDVVLLVAFVRTAGEDLVGVLQRKTANLIKLAGEMGKLVREPVVDAEVKARLRTLVDGAFDSLCAHLERGHEQLGRLEKKMERDRLTNGSLTEEKDKNLDESRKAYEALLGNVSSLASSLNRDMPQLPEEEEEEEAGGISLWEGGIGGDRSGYTGPFEESERNFYEDLPDLLNTIPPNLLGLTEEQAEQLREQERLKLRERAAETADDTPVETGDGQGEGDGSGDGEDSLVENISGLSLEGDGGGAGEEIDGGLGTVGSDDEGKPGGAVEDDGDDAEEGGGEYMSRNARLTLMLEDELPNCHNQERVDEFAKNFCYVNSKGARKKLVAALFNVPRQALDLLPMYARLVAILDKAMKTIAPMLLDELKSHFRYFLRKKAPGQIDHRTKNVRFIGELVKFRVAPPVTAFQCLKACLNDFSSGAVQTLCALLETCGRFLFRQKLTHQRMKSFLVVMMKLKKAKNLDQRLEALMDNAFYTCCPPERQQRATKVRTPLQLYIRHLMLERLRDDTDVVEGIVKQLRKLPWQEPEANVEAEVIRVSLRLCRSRYPCIHLAADVISGLARYQDRVAVRVVDIVLEELHRGIELPGGNRDSQRLVGYARLLAEMYNYALVGSPTIFETLHLLLDSGYEVPSEMKEPWPIDPKNPSKGVAPPLVPPWARYDPRVRTPTDPPGDCLRIRLVVAILEGCGSYFVRGAGLVKLSKFLSVFQRYLFCKERLPAGTEFAVLDLMEELESGAQAAREKDRAKAKKTAEEGRVKGGSGRRGRGDGTGTDGDVNDSGPILPRHRTWEDAQRAVDVFDRDWDEDHRRRVAKMAKLQGGGLDGGQGEEGVSGGVGGATDEEGDGEDDEGDEDDDDDRGASGSEGEEGEDAGVAVDREEPQEDNGDKEGSSEDDFVVHETSGVERTEEDGEADDEFEALLSKTLSESVEKTKIARATTQVMGHMAVPIVHKNTNVRRATRESPLTGGTGMAFKLLKRGNKGKMEAQEVMVPASTSLAAQVSRNEEANREENSIIKARVLAYEANIEAAVMAQEAGAVPSPEDYTKFIPKVRNAPLHPDGNKGGAKGSAGPNRGGRDFGSHTGRGLGARGGRGGGRGGGGAGRAR